MQHHPNLGMRKEHVKQISTSWPMQGRERVQLDLACFKVDDNGCLM